MQWTKVLQRIALQIVSPPVADLRQVELRRQTANKPPEDDGCGRQREDRLAVRMVKLHRPVLLRHSLLPGSLSPLRNPVRSVQMNTRNTR